MECSIHSFVDFSYLKFDLNILIYNLNKLYTKHEISTKL